MMLDVASLKVRTIVHDTSRRVGNWTWREDSKSIVAVMLQQPQSGRATIDEITVNGDRKPLFDPGNARTLSGFQFVGGSAVVYRTDSAWFLAPLGGGAPRRLAGVPLGTRVGTTVVSNDHAWFGGPLQDPKRSEYNQLELITIASGERKVIELPFNLGWSFQPQLTDDNRAMLVFGRARSDSIGLKLYRVPLNGDPPRAIANIGGLPSGAAVSLSPNGQSFVYAAHDSRTSTLLLVDLRPALSASSRSPR
jgi:hypothetical protein